MIQNFLCEEEGQTLVEYGLLIGLLALAAVGGMMFLGNRARGPLQSVGNNMVG